MANAVKLWSLSYLNRKFVLFNNTTIYKYLLIIGHLVNLSLGTPRNHRIFYVHRKSHTQAFDIPVMWHWLWQENTKEWVRWGDSILRCRYLRRVPDCMHCACRTRGDRSTHYNIYISETRLSPQTPASGSCAISPLMCYWGKWFFNTA